MSAKNTADTELWLVRVPHGFDVSALNKLNTSVFGLDGNSQTLKVKTGKEKSFYSVSASREETNYRKTFTMVTGADSQMSLGGELLNTLTVTQTAAPATESVDSVDSAFPTPAPAPASCVCMPTGLRQRFMPFGADTPCPSVSRKKKKKKDRAWKGEEPMEEEVCQDVRKSSKKRKREENHNHHEEEHEVKREEGVQDTKKRNKKRKREENLDHHDEEIEVKREEEVQDTKKRNKKRKREENLNHHDEEIEVKREEEVHQDTKKSSKKRKREESPDHYEEEPDKKKRKSKHRHSEPVDLHNGDTGNTLASPTKQKRRQSEGTIQDRSVNDDLFVIDTTGDQRLGKDDSSDSNKKHKKSKKHKKHRQSM